MEEIHVPPVPDHVHLLARIRGGQLRLHREDHAGNGLKLTPPQSYFQRFYILTFIKLLRAVLEI